MAIKSQYTPDYSSLETYDTSKQALLKMLQKFYPDDWRNFESGKAGGMIVDAFAFIGNILHFTQGQYFMNSFPQTVTNRQKAVNLAQWYGFNNIGPTLPWVTVSFTISVNATNGVIDTTHIPKILPGATLYSGDHSLRNFFLTNKIDFTKIPESQWTKYYSSDGSLSRVEMTGYGFCTTYEQRTVTHTVSPANPNDTFEKFYEINLSQPNVQQIMEITDQDGNKYYEVDHLVQDTVFEYILNENDDNNNIPYLLFNEKAKYRFIKKQYISNSDEKVYTKLIFGNTSETEYNERSLNINPNDTVLPADYLGLDTYSTAINQLQNKDYDPENMLLIDTLGVGPSRNDVLTIKYITGDGSTTKVSAGKLNRVKSVTWNWNDDTQSADIIASLKVNNNEPGAGGRAALTTEEIKHYATSYGLNQKRAVTPTDYAGIILSMPEYLGRPDKIYATRSQSSADPFKFDVYMLSIDGDGHYFDPTKNAAFIHNMRLYLKKYKGLNDLIVLKSGKIINIQLEFDIVIGSGYSQNEVTYNVLARTKEFFEKDKWDFGKHFKVYDLINWIMKNVTGIISVSGIKVKRPPLSEITRYQTNYSNQSLEYDYKQNKYFIPSDSILEIKYPNSDIKINVDIAN